MLVPLRLLALLPPLLQPTLSFYLPGVDPLTFPPNSPVGLKVNALSSTHTQLPLDYYSMPFCAPDGGPEMSSENLGEFLTGNKIQTSPYHLYMLLDDFCHVRGGGKGGGAGGAEKRPGSRAKSE
ncbi:hypothetical protein TeGR_g11921, partial [Tetraparma gracilis]